MDFWFGVSGFRVSLFELFWFIVGWAWQSVEKLMVDVSWNGRR